MKVFKSLFILGICLFTMMIMKPALAKSITWECNSTVCKPEGYYDLKDFEDAINVIFPATLNKYNNLSSIQFSIKSTNNQAFLDSGRIFNSNLRGPWDETRPLYPQLEEIIGSQRFPVLDITPRFDDLQYYKNVLITIQAFNDDGSQVVTLYSGYAPLQVLLNDTSCLFYFPSVMQGNVSVGESVEMKLPINIQCNNHHTVTVQISGDSNFSSTISKLVSKEGLYTPVSLTLRNEYGQDSDTFSQALIPDQKVLIYAIGKATPSIEGSFSGSGYVKVTVN